MTVGLRAGSVNAEKAAPVDVITRVQIAAGGFTETAQLIESLAPSLDCPRPTIADGTGS